MFSRSVISFEVCKYQISIVLTVKTPRAIELAAHHKAYGPAGHVCGDNNVNHLHYVEMWLVAFIEAKQQSIDTFALTQTQYPKFTGASFVVGLSYLKGLLAQMWGI